MSSSPRPQQRRARRDLACVRPSAVGFSAERLARLDASLRQLVERREFAGIGVLAARRGKIFHAVHCGARDLARHAPLTPDTIFRIHSMTKPVTGVAMMLLYEEGRWRMDDPLAAHIPEFRELRVWPEAAAKRRRGTVAPSHPPTMRELLTHTAGFSYGASEHAVDRQYRDNRGRNLVLESASLGEMIGRLARIPLLWQPGTHWVYSVSVDIQGYLVEKLSGLPLAEFFQQRIFAPLGMNDTGFFVPPEKRVRFAEFYKRTPSGELEPVTETIAGLRDYAATPGMPSGGAGLVSTAGDYLRFAQMLLNGGELNGTRLLSPTSLKLMAANHLSEAVFAASSGNGVLPPGIGFGLDFGIITDPARAATPLGRGTFYWAGLGGAWFWVDPVHDLVCVGMAQRTDTPDRPNLFALSSQMLYQAMIE